MLRAARRNLSSGSAASRLAARMAEELQAICPPSTSAAAGRASSVPASPVVPPVPRQAKKPAKELVRKMPDHLLPNYMEANFRTMQFVLTRAPKVSDFPKERVYRHDSLDLLFRHYYMNWRS